MRVLITGTDSYIGQAVKQRMKERFPAVTVDEADMKNDGWERLDFGGYDSVVHVAGIVHMKEKKKLKDIYFRVNTDLAFKTAEKAKRDGAGQFILFSSMSIYGLKTGKISKDTLPEPDTYYGRSKLKAEEMIMCLSSDEFRTVFIRPPMVYGKGCKGNYPKLSAFARKAFFFPSFRNERSMIYIENLAEFTCLLIKNKENGVFFPQNKEYVETSEMVRLIALAHGRKIHMTRIFSPILRIFSNNVLSKVFGSLTYEKYMSDYKEEYNIAGFEESIIRTES